MMVLPEMINFNFSAPLETRKKTQLYFIASKEDLAHAETTSVRIKLRFWWRKLIKTRIKDTDAPIVATE